MARVMIDIDPEAPARARTVLGTRTLGARVNPSLRQAERRATRRDFDVERDIDDTPADVEADRDERTP